MKVCRGRERGWSKIQCCEDTKFDCFYLAICEGCNKNLNNFAMPINPHTPPIHLASYPCYQNIFQYLPCLISSYSQINGSVNIF